ncbi:diacylglycerol kinase [Neisseria sp.]|uniref:diacylglycerol kinase n=1 Tax=Neisseria sp. TaxID=192066 RepID=UPI00359F2EEA
MYRPEHEQENYAAAQKGKHGIRRIINAAGYSRDGFSAAYRHESAFRQVLWLNAALVVLAFVLDFGSAERMMLVAASFLSLIVELFNTAIEAAVDHTSTEKHELAKRAKDAGSAAQLAALLLLAVLWLTALFG